MVVRRWTSSGYKAAGMWGHSENMSSHSSSVLCGLETSTKCFHVSRQVWGVGRQGLTPPHLTPECGWRRPRGPRSAWPAEHVVMCDLSCEQTRLSERCETSAWRRELTGVTEASAPAQCHPGKPAEGKTRLHKSCRLLDSSG